LKPSTPEAFRITLARAEIRTVRTECRRDGLRLTRGEHVPVDWSLKRFLLDALQSKHFNRLLARRINEGLFEQVVLGDWARRYDTGGTFLGEHTREKERPRRSETSDTLPLYGRNVRISGGQVGLLEQEILGAMGLA
jgi:tRNA pseudouridine13 synthase